jgi:hypothetical protein
MYPIIEIPKDYWLDVNKFDFNTFTYQDLRDIYNSPTTLIDDFSRNPYFIKRVQEINKINDSKKKKKILELENNEKKELEDKMIEKYNNLKNNTKYGNLDSINYESHNYYIKLPSIFNFFK